MNFLRELTGRVEPTVEVTSTNGEWPLAYPPILQHWVLIVGAK